MFGSIRVTRDMVLLLSFLGSVFLARKSILALPLFFIMGLISCYNFRLSILLSHTLSVIFHYLSYQFFLSTLPSFLFFVSVGPDNLYSVIILSPELISILLHINVYNLPLN